MSAQVQGKIPEIVSLVIEKALGQSWMTNQVNIAIDGICGGGKSTLAAALAEKYECNLFHMDDFFLQPAQRTAARLSEPGGNVDYERFRAEVLERLEEEGGFAYRPFDCGRMDFGEQVRVSWRRLNIIEGAYSCHPYFGDAYQARFFVDVSPKAQRERLLAREGAERYRRFEWEWIPMENRYFEAFHIREKCILISM